ncbi:MAG: ATP-binding protein [Spirochaetales bacterium]|nr:ATP-binding protein [Spirochaetales bacterium]
MFERDILKELRKWRDNDNRKPLVLRGARQVGKTSVVKIFSQEFENFISLNMEDSSHRGLFDPSFSFEQRISAVLLQFSVPRNGSSTLVFIDEIQASPQAVATLRYFYELTPHIHVIAAGSLLETAIDMSASFPVGRVEFLMLYPCSFMEFLNAIGEQQLFDLFSQLPFPEYAHSKALDLFRQYMLVGGMPEAVDIYSENRDLVEVNSVYEGLLTSFLEDVEKYSKESFQRVVRHVIQSAFAEIGNRVKFSGFGNSSYSSRDIREAFELVHKAMLMQIIYPTTSVTLPIIPDYKKAPRLLLLDSGLLQYQSGLQAEVFLAKNPESVVYGRIVEHIVGQMLMVNLTKPSAKLNFWVREKKQSNAEVDYVVQYQDKIIPVEVKSGASGRLRSLHQFIDQAPHAFAVRIGFQMLSVEEARTLGGKEYRLLNLPIYLASNLFDYLKWFVHD